MCNKPPFSPLLSVNTLILQHFFPAAGNAFAQAAHLHLQMQSKHDAATNLIDAGNAFKKADPQGNVLHFCGFIYLFFNSQNLFCCCEKLHCFIKSLLHLFFLNNFFKNKKVFIHQMCCKSNKYPHKCMWTRIAF